MHNISKRGQMAIFIIVAIVILALIVLIFLFRPKILGIGETELSPNSYLSSCIKPEIKPAIEQLSKQGGYQNPEGTALYNGAKIQYLCYTGDNYKTCTIQQPMIKANFEKELNLMLKARANNCMNNLISEYKKRGYEVSSGSINSELSIIPGEIIVSYNAPLTVKKETAKTFKNFNVKFESEMYDLLFIAQSIVESESKLGGSATELYLQYYPDLKIDKTKLSESTTIYKLSNVVTKEDFNFASRSLAWPAGYGVEE